MFENRSEKQLIIIYAFIAASVASGMGAIHVLQGWDHLLIVVVANIWFACLFYILYLPLKVRRQREKQEKEQKK